MTSYCIKNLIKIKLTSAVKSLLSRKNVNAKPPSASDPVLISDSVVFSTIMRICLRNWLDEVSSIQKLTVVLLV